MHRNDFVRQLSSPGGDRRPSRRMHIDIPLLIILLILCGIGLAVLYSASGENLFYVERQATFMVIGLISMIFMAQFPPRGWERYAMLIYFGGLLALIAVLFVGVGAKGAQRWLDLGVTRFQPSELMKIAVPMMLSAFLSKLLTTLNHLIRLSWWATPCPDCRTASQYLKVLPVLSGVRARNYSNWIQHCIREAAALPY
mgnify:CR=1 FL=1